MSITGLSGNASAGSHRNRFEVVSRLPIATSSAKSHLLRQHPIPNCFLGSTGLLNSLEPVLLHLAIRNQKAAMYSRFLFGFVSASPARLAWRLAWRVGIVDQPGQQLELCDMVPTGRTPLDVVPDRTTPAQDTLRFKCRGQILSRFAVSPESLELQPNDNRHLVFEVGEPGHAAFFRNFERLIGVERILRRMEAKCHTNEQVSKLISPAIGGCLCTR